MKEEKITQKLLLDFENYLLEEEKSEVTIEKYIRDVRSFYEFIGKRYLSKELTISYKQMLLSRIVDEKQKKEFLV